MNDETWTYKTDSLAPKDFAVEGEDYVLDEDDVNAIRTAAVNLLKSSTTSMYLFFSPEDVALGYFLAAAELMQPHAALLLEAGLSDEELAEKIGKVGQYAVATARELNERASALEAEEGQS